MAVVLKRCLSSAANAARIITCPDKLVYPALPMHQNILNKIDTQLDTVLLVSNLCVSVITIDCLHV